MSSVRQNWSTCSGSLQEELAVIVASLRGAKEASSFLRQSRLVRPLGGIGEGAFASYTDDEKLSGKRRPLACGFWGRGCDAMPHMPQGCSVRESRYSDSSACGDTFARLLMIGADLSPAPAQQMELQEAMSCPSNNDAVSSCWHFEGVAWLHASRQKPLLET